MRTILLMIDSVFPLSITPETKEEFPPPLQSLPHTSLNILLQSIFPNDSFLANTKLANVLCCCSFIFAIITTVFFSAIFLPEKNGSQNRLNHRICLEQ